MSDALVLALATVNGNLAQLTMGGCDTSIPWKVSALRESEQTWAALLTHGVLTSQAVTPDRDVLHFSVALHPDLG